MKTVRRSTGGRARRGGRVATTCLVLPLAALLASSAGSEPRVPEALPGAPAFSAPLRMRLDLTLVGLGADHVPRTRHRRPDGRPLYTNRLLLETSPYLQQHAHNPVDWHPWGDEAFALARRLKRPVLVSIGYSTCHWCHVMEEETFDDLGAAEYLNAHFVAIKVDREVRPDVDSIYMSALRAMGRRGGWPLNVFLTAERQPFFGGTYFPRDSFLALLKSIQQRHQEDPESLEGSARKIARTLKRSLEGEAATSTHALESPMLHRATESLAARFDSRFGGLGTRPKFPSKPPVRFLLRYHRRTGDAQALRMATRSLEAMARGGIHDQIGGGFHRYATDQRWRVPHFEKMLYDNALLAVAYLEGWQVTGRADFAEVTRQILRYVQREMTAAGGAFYSATDADSPDPHGELEEGRFFTWTPAELRELLEAEPARALLAYYGISEQGNFEGRSIPHIPREPAEVARALGLPTARLLELVEGGRERLYAARLRRPAPLLDDKILTAWNGLMISAFARAGFALDEPRWLQAAARAADFLLAELRPEGRLMRVWRDRRLEGPAFLEDYAFLIAGLLDLYEARSEPRWLREAMALQARLDAHHADRSGGGYFKTADDHERLLAREKSSQDGAIPSGNSVAALNLLRLHELTGKRGYREQAEMLFSAFHDGLRRHPGAFGDMLLALDFALDSPKEVVLVRREGSGDLAAMLAPLRRSFLPNRIVAVVTEGEDLERHGRLVPLVQRKIARGGEVTAYVCEKGVCDLPTAEPEVFARQLAKVLPLEKVSEARP